MHCIKCISVPSAVSIRLDFTKIRNRNRSKYDRVQSWGADKLYSTHKILYKPVVEIDYISYLKINLKNIMTLNKQTWKMLCTNLVNLQMHTRIMLYLVICTMHCVVKFKASTWMICTASIKHYSCGKRKGIKFCDF